MHNITARIPAHEKKYPIIIGRGAIAELGKIIEELNPVSNVIAVFDESICGYAEKIKKSIGNCGMIPVKSGEKSKSLKEAERISEELLKSGANRRSVLINIGGGMLTDLAGFVASIYMRGIRFINVPTTLLGMVDAAIGGKTGVDLGEAKNMIGHFHHPSAVIEDIDFLESLPDRSIKEGLVEVIKMAAMLDKNFFSFLENNIPETVGCDTDLLEQCISRAVELKTSVVEQDEMDKSARMFLNFGHTVGHALEAVSSFKISHGEAVSVGMVAEIRITKSMETEQVEALLQKIGMPTEIPKEFTLKTLMPFMLNDKKNLSEDLRMAVPSTIGKGEIRSFDPHTIEL